MRKRPGSSNTTGSYLESLGKYDEAEKRYRRGLEIHRNILGEHHGETARSYNNVAVLLYNRKRFREAADLNRTALDIRRKVLDASPQDIAPAKTTWPTAWTNRANLPTAEKLHHLAYKARLQALGEDHPETIGSLCNLAFNLRSQGRYDEAETTWTRPLLLRAGTLESREFRIGTGRFQRGPFADDRSGGALGSTQPAEGSLGAAGIGPGTGPLRRAGSTRCPAPRPASGGRNRNSLTSLQALENKITAARLPGNVVRPGCRPT